MAALPDESYGVDPQTMEEMPMPEQAGDMPPELEALGSEGPVDPMLQQEPDEDEYDNPSEVERRNDVELDLLNAISCCAKAVEMGEHATDPQWVQSFGQAASSLAQAFEALMRTEQAENKQQWDAQVPADQIRV